MLERSGSLNGGLQVLELLCARPEGLSSPDLLRETGRDRAGLQRLLGVLTEAGYVDLDPVSRRYRATVQIVGLAARILENLNLIDIARPVMRALLASTGETIHLAQRTTRGGVYVAHVRPAGRLSVETEIGAPVSLHCSSTGKSLYAEAPEHLVRLLELPLTGHTVRTHRTVESLLEDLAEVRQRGYAIDDEEHHVGIRCVAAPIRDVYGTTIASIGISGPETRMTLARLPELGAEIRAAAETITAALGGPPSARA